MLLRYRYCSLILLGLWNISSVLCAGALSMYMSGYESIMCDEHFAVGYAAKLPLLSFRDCRLWPSTMKNVLSNVSFWLAKWALISSSCLSLALSASSIAFAEKYKFTRIFTKSDVICSNYHEYFTQLTRCLERTWLHQQLQWLRFLQCFLLVRNARSVYGTVYRLGVLVTHSLYLVTDLLLIKN